MEQQVKRKRVKKSYVAPTDPLWRDQWPLVSHVTWTSGIVLSHVIRHLT